MANKMVENGFIKSFNSKLRNEYLNTEIFFTLKDALQKLERWHKDYNEQGPTVRFWGLPPTEHLRAEREKVRNRHTHTEDLRRPEKNAPNRTPILA